MEKHLTLFKLLADETRLKILSALNEKDSYVELLAERLQLSAPTVSFHLKKLHAAGLVDARREQYYTMYSLRQPIFDVPLASLIFQDTPDQNAEAMREEMYRRKVLKSFMPQDYCEVMPAQLKKRVIIYAEIFSHFSPGTYTEKEVNQIITQYHADFCLVRRAFVEMGWMSREKGVYTVLEQPDHPETLWQGVKEGDIEA